MKNISLPYGKKELLLKLPEGPHYEFIAPIDHSASPDPLQTVGEALDHPCDGVRLFDFPAPRKVAIAINDKTRPVPHFELLYPLVRRLNNMGVSNAQIIFIIASGTHKPMPSTEYPEVLPKELSSNHTVIAHDCDCKNELKYLGTTSFGTPVWANRVFMEADIRIVVGNIEPHHFMGFSGGVKSAAIGLSGRETICHNHAFITHPNARLGCYENNPMRQDVEEIGKMMGVHYAVNAILDKDKNLVHAVAGEPLAVMAAGIPLSRKICQVPVTDKFDVVIASCGGYPKDINLYQAQKAQTNASLITRDGGTIILVAQCVEGIGSQGFEEFMQDVHSIDEVIKKFKQSEFQIGPHKAFLFARIGRRVNTMLVSEISQSVVKNLLLTPSSNVNAALKLALANCPDHPRIAILPHAVATVPLIV
ncbi:MAG: nickel-dependent lactate racemase [Anaerolineaceae bacterium]|nr:nickel-dependent lactate racemase [Anaerolineaceae bacterium]